VSTFKVAFDSMAWQAVRAGVRHKVHVEGTRQLRLVEFATSDGFDEWCQQGHVGYVLAGGLELDVNGAVLSFAAGDGLFLPSGVESQHRAVSITPGTRLLMVEDIGGGDTR
jgi:quercetin dioxygenase-like cupin family protein